MDWGLWLRSKGNRAAGLPLSQCVASGFWVWAHCTWGREKAVNEEVAVSQGFSGTEPVNSC